MDTPKESKEAHRQRLRKEIRKRRSQLSPAEYAQLSKALVTRLCASECLSGVGTVAAFWPVRGEPDILPALELMKKKGLRIVLPVAKGASIAFAEAETFNRDQNPPGKWGIPEPRGSIIPLTEVDLFLVPGLVFEMNGGRLGSGGGYYDRIFPNTDADSVRVGLCFSFQIVDDLPLMGHDIPMHFVIHEKAAIACSPEGRETVIESGTEA